MAQPYPQNKRNELEFNKKFLSFIKDRPFYIVSLNNKPKKSIGRVDGDKRGELYYVGELLGGNAIFSPESRLEVYWFEKGVRQDSTYWLETIIDNFEARRWYLVDMYENGLSYQDVVKNLESMDDFNPFDGINETKERLEHPINVDTVLYCHTAVNKYRVGEWYPVIDVNYGGGNKGEDAIVIHDKDDKESQYMTWTIQKDENGLNYENWFSLGDSSFDTHGALDKLYESEDLDWSVEDHTKYLKVGQKFKFKSRVPTSDNHEIIGQIVKINDNYVWIAPVNEITKKVNKFARPTRFTNDRILQILVNGDWTPINDINETKKEDEFKWVKDIIKSFNKNYKQVIVTNKGSYYPTNLEAMVELDVTGAKEFRNTYGNHWWDHSEYDGEGWDDSENFLHKHIPSLVSPENGDICFLVKSITTGSPKKKGNIISRLIRVSDNGEFVMDGYGFEPHQS